MVKKTDFNYPSSDDLKSHLRFSPETGHIWLGEQRMLLIHSEAMGSMRRELIETMGMERAKGIIMRTGYQSGVEDAKLARQLRPDASEIDQFLVGPQLHQLEGIVRVTPIKFELNSKKKQFYMELRWENSYESEVHQKAFGVSDDPVCWMEVGYASGYSSEFTGQAIIFSEQACRACGNDSCLIIGKPAADWQNIEELTQYYQADSVVDQMLDLRDEVVSLRSSLMEQEKQDSHIIGVSKPFKDAFGLLEKATQGPVTVLLLGETGVGKELFARSLHRKSCRNENPFIAVNCAAIPDDLLEAELFGVDKGAYTGAHQSREGRFERANGGTLFLDEIGDLSYSAQAKLLRVLQEGEIERVGGVKVIKVDVRVVAATHADLLEKIDKGEFRRDLFYRLNVYPISVPPLRDRQCDIALLANSFIDQYKIKYHKEVKGITHHAMAQLEAYQWPGNIRELENIIERGVLLCDNGSKIELQHLFAMMDVEQATESVVDESGQLKTVNNGVYNQFVEMFFEAQNNLFEIEKTILQESVNRARGNLSSAARSVGMTRPQLAYRLGKIEKES
ncbi:MAG: sigma-54-dependent Fis family transcriptional regulator [Piscirickettsiaceae bacterium]|nr:MAG: sigma-54-dependent Fis family transcriptional regulator [Piscirickettsiaceae bacterium]